MSHTIERLRSDAVAAFSSAVAAVQPGNLVPKAVRVRGDEVLIWGRPLPEVPGRRIVAAIGKAAPGLAAAWLELLPAWADQMLVLAPHGTPVADRVSAAATVRRGAHPVPDQRGVVATRELLELAAGLGPDDLLVVLLSGGGSALLAAPDDGLALEDVQATTRALLSSGAPIEAVNTVRRQLLAAAGGGLARAAYPAQVVTLVLSDVIGDPLPAIASGPTVPSPTTAADALGVLEQFAIRVAVPRAVVDLLEARSGISNDLGWVQRSHVQILANNRSAVDAAARLLGERRYRVIVHGGVLEGEAAARGRQLGALAGAMNGDRPVAFLVGGETTVTVRGSGRGGRSHELALAAALELAGCNGRVLLAAGTDGIDGMTGAAGAVVDPTTAGRLAAASIDPRAVLADNDSGAALAAIGDAIVTGPTGTNVCDLVVALVSRSDAVGGGTLPLPTSEPATLLKGD